MASINFILEHFSLAITVFEILTFEIVDLEKVGQGHGVRHWQCRSQFANVQIYKRHFFYIFDFRQDLTCAHDSHTYAQTELHKAIDIGKIADLPKNQHERLESFIAF